MGCCGHTGFEGKQPDHSMKRQVLDMTNREIIVIFLCVNFGLTKRIIMHDFAIICTGDSIVYLH